MKMQINSMKSVRANLLKFSKIFVFTAASVMFFFLYSSCVESYPNKEWLIFFLVDKEGLDVNNDWHYEHAVQGIEAELRNDKLSEDPIRKYISSADGGITIKFSSSTEFKNDKAYQDVVFLDEEEFNQLLTDSSDYYIVINPEKSPLYNDRYETLRFKGKDVDGNGYRVAVYLPPKNGSD